MLTLDLALITYRPEGIRRVAAQNLPQLPGVRYVVSWQQHEDAPVPPELAAREDIEVYRFANSGLSANRNNALDHCTADIVLFADDDIIYTSEEIQTVIRTFEKNPEVDVATFIAKMHGEKQYPSNPTPLHDPWPKNYSVASFEIAFRRTTAGDMRCCPELGLGSPRLHCGEDEMFLFSAIKRGLRCKFFPEVICAHPHPSTGTKAHFTDGNLRGSGCVIALMRPRTAVLRVPLKAWRVARAGQASFPRALWHITLGALSAPGVIHRNHNYLW